MRVRERGSLGSELVYIGYKHYTNVLYGALNDYTIDTFYNEQSSYERTEDEIHPLHPHQGGPFESLKCNVSYQKSSVVCGQEWPAYAVNANPRFWYTYRKLYTGDVFATCPDPALHYYLPKSEKEVASSFGATAWNRMNPARPKVSLSVFIAELKDVLTLKDIARQITKFRDLGGKYLNYQFGWKPFLSDLSSWYKSIINIDEQVDRFRKQNSQWQKRRVYLGKSSDSNIQIASDALTPTFYAYDINAHDTYTENVDTWATGRFRYFIPNLNDPKWGTAKSVMKLWDLDIGPSQLYQLIPWSWLVDWHCNLGTVIENICAQQEDNVVSKYAYIMRHKTQKVTRNVTANYRLYRSTAADDFVSTPVSVSTTITRDSKTRVEATPFGFNSTFDGYTANQAAILAALGLSRLRF